MTPAHSTVPYHPRPSSAPTQTTCSQVAPYTPGVHYSSPAMPTAKPVASRNQRTSPYADSDATTPTSASGKIDDFFSPAAPAPVHDAPATTSAPPAPESVNDNKVVDAPFAKKKNFLIITDCEWLRCPPAEEWVRTAKLLASFKFVPATLDEEEKKMFDAFLNPDMIEN